MPVRAVAAYYAPQAGYALTAGSSSPARDGRDHDVLLVLAEKGCEVRGGFALLPETEKRFRFDFSVPAGWQVTSVTGPDEQPLAMERYGGRPTGPGRVHVRLPQGIEPGPAVRGPLPRRLDARRAGSAIGSPADRVPRVRRGRGVARRGGGRGGRPGRHGGPARPARAPRAAHRAGEGQVRPGRRRHESGLPLREAAATRPRSPSIGPSRG